MKKPSKVQCKTCPFRNDEQAILLPPMKMVEIYEYLENGANHICHNDIKNELVCRGARDWQLKRFVALGLIAAATDEALAAAMTAADVNPRKHI